jgi:DHA1 family bicyclomycin/chloramphenicol resistance-like MFS transporter
MSTLSAAMAIIPMIAPSIGALILQFAAWPAVFVALAVFAALVLAALSRLPETTSNTSNERLTLRMVLSSFSEMLRRPSFLGYQMAGSFSFAALFVYLSTVAFFLPDVFNIPTSLFGYAFALTVFGFMTGSLINARLVMRFGMDQTLKAGLTISLLAALLIVLVSANASAHLYAMAALSSIFFLGVGLTASNASMGAISQFTNKAGSASAVYGFTHALLASAIGAMAGVLYQGRLLEPALIMLGCAMLAFSGLWLVHWRSRDQQAAT